MTSLSNAITSIPAHSITLALGGLTTSYVFFSNIGETQRGIIPYLNGRLTAVKLGDKDRAKLWKGYFGSAAKWIVGSSLLSSALSLTTSYLHRSPIISRLTLASGITSLLILPITYISGLLPINARLYELADEDKPVTSTKEDEAKQLIKTWEERHLRRMPTYAVAWGLTALAIVLDGRV